MHLYSVYQTCLCYSRTLATTIHSSLILPATLDSTHFCAHSWPGRLCLTAPYTHMGAGLSPLCLSFLAAQPRHGLVKSTFTVCVLLCARKTLHRWSRDGVDDVSKYRHVRVPNIHASAPLHCIALPNVHPARERYAIARATHNDPLYLCPCNFLSASPVGRLLPQCQ
jgi:hypothetical protein